MKLVSWPMPELRMNKSAPRMASRNCSSRSLFPARLPLQNLHLWKTRAQHRRDALIELHRPQDDAHFRQMLLDDAQRARRVPDVADIDGIPRGLEQNRLRLLRGGGRRSERGGERGDELTARGSGGERRRHEAIVFSFRRVGMQKMRRADSHASRWSARQAAGPQYVVRPGSSTAYAFRPISSGIGRPLSTIGVGRPLKSLMVIFDESIPRWW